MSTLISEHSIGTIIFKASISIEALIIRPIEDRDYEPVGALVRIVAPDRGASARSWRHSDARAGELHRTHRYVAVEPGSQQIVGYGAYWWVRLRKFRLDLMVLPAWRRRGFGGRLMRRLFDDLALQGGATVQARADEEDLETLTFLWRFGFVETQRMYRLVLDVAAANLAPWHNLEQQLAMQGISISTLSYERAHDPAVLHKLYDLHTAALPDWPDPDPAPSNSLTFADYLRRFEQDAILPEGFFIAKRGNQYIGYSGVLEAFDTSRCLYSAGTAVRPPDRHIGVATALKVRTIAFAQQHKYQLLIANTASLPMLALNLRLGFRRERAEVRLVRAL
jgi:GNAT superfamily N-acetyltransferase